MLNSKNLLPNTLKANAAFSLVSALIVVLGRQIPAIQELSLGLPYLFAISLVIFAAYVAYCAFGKPVSLKLARSVIAMDLFYVITSVVYLIAVPSLSLTGKILIGFVAVIVADFAALQYKGVKNLAQHDTGGGKNIKLLRVEY